MAEEQTAENTNQAETDANETLLNGEGQQAENQETQQADNAETNADEKNGESKDGDTDQAPAFDPTKVELPEGVESLDEGLMAEFGPMAEELKLTQEQGQKLISMHAKTLQSMQEAQQAQRSEMIESWAKEAKADKEIGGDKFDANLSVAKSALDKFGTPELKEMLDSSGLGNHPEVIRFFHKVGKEISEDNPVSAKPDTGQKKSIEERLYGG